MNGEVVPMYEWHEVNGSVHAFNRFANSDTATWWSSLCRQRFAAQQVKLSLPRLDRGRIVTAGRCVACIHLADAGSI